MFVLLGILSFFLLTKQTTERQNTDIISKMTSPVSTVTTSPTLQTQTYSEEEAKKFFENFIQLESNFNPMVLDFYAKNAVVKSTRIYPDNTTRDLELSMDQFRQLLLVALPLGKQRNDRSTYSDITYHIGTDSVKITAKRFSHLKQYTADYYMIIKYEGDQLKIVEEFSESRP